MKLSDTLQGSLWMVLAMLGFALEDMVIKSLAASLPAGQIILIMGLLGMAAFALHARAQGHALWHPGFGTRAMVWRSVAEVAGRLSFAMALVLVPLSLASAILQATPLVVTAGAVLLFGETVGWRRWLAIGIGLLGVLIILRPGVAGFDLAALWAVAGMLGFAGRDLATRAAPMTMSTAQLGILGFAMLAVAGLVLLGAEGRWVAPSPTQWGSLALLALIGAFAYSALTRAMRTGEIGVVAPFRYFRLVIAMGFGVLVFGERPDLWTLVGSVLVVGSGLFTLWRSAKR